MTDVFERSISHHFSRHTNERYKIETYANKFLELTPNGAETFVGQPHILLHFVSSVFTAYLGKR